MYESLRSRTTNDATSRTRDLGERGLGPHWIGLGSRRVAGADRRVGRCRIRSRYRRWSTRSPRSMAGRPWRASVQPRVVDCGTNVEIKPSSAQAAKDVEKISSHRRRLVGELGVAWVVAARSFGWSETITGAMFQMGIGIALTAWAALGLLAAKMISSSGDNTVVVRRRILGTGPMTVRRPDTTFGV